METDADLLVNWTLAAGLAVCLTLAAASCVLISLFPFVFLCRSRPIWSQQKPIAGAFPARLIYNRNDSLIDSPTGETFYLLVRQQTSGFDERSEDIATHFFSLFCNLMFHL